MFTFRFGGHDGMGVLWLLLLLWLLLRSDDWDYYDVILNVLHTRGCRLCKQYWWTVSVNTKCMTTHTQYYAFRVCQSGYISIKRTDEWHCGSRHTLQIVCDTVDCSTDSRSVHNAHTYTHIPTNIHVMTI